MKNTMLEAVASEWRRYDPPDSAPPITAALVELYAWQMRGVAIAKVWEETLELDTAALAEVDEGIRTSRDAITAALTEAGVAL
ncbi:MAG: hypothetical protein M0R37_10430 [Bacteroidales bacterium]|nr:hypothetical protein [Bacteroidales bacterium]